MLTSAKHVVTYLYSMTTDAIYTKNADLIGHSKILSWGQLDGCSVTRPFLSLQRVWLARLVSLLETSISLIFGMSHLVHVMRLAALGKGESGIAHLSVSYYLSIEFLSPLQEQNPTWQPMYSMQHRE